MSAKGCVSQPMQCKAVWTCVVLHSVKVVIVTSAKEYMFLSFVCPLATLHKNFQTDLHEIFKEGWQCANEEVIKFR